MPELHPTTRVRLVIIKDNKLLVQYRQKQDFFHYIGGHVDYGDTILSACLRETKEECGDDVNFKLIKILYIRDFILPQENESATELFILGDIDKTDGLEGLKDPQHPDGTVWLTWLDMDHLPANLLPAPLTPKLLSDYRLGFPTQGEYIGRMDK